jgi:hypothetical protein
LLDSPVTVTDTSRVTSFRRLFRGVARFNQSVRWLDMGSALDVASMFHGAASFDQPLDHLDLRQVLDARQVLQDAAAFNRPIDWRLDRVQQLTGAFAGAAALDSPVTLRTSPALASVHGLLAGAARFDAPLVITDTSGVADFSELLSGRAGPWVSMRFNRPLAALNTSAAPRGTCRAGTSPA